ncbi:MAG TPA: hypothetical protein VMU92_02705 [Acidobacteriaceae bacterium]|nr:hypothetical protein [Acidobacteriaceae bacterium]
MAILIFVCLIADLRLKNAADLQQVLWSCYWGAIVIASGILAASERLVAWGTVFFAGLGVPAWLLGLVLDFHLEVTSVLIHTLPFVAGLIYIRKMSALPAHSALGAWSLYIVPFIFSWKLTNPDAMINLSHWNRSAVPSLPIHVWQFYLLLIPISFLTILLAVWFINRWLARRAAAHARPVMAAGG